MSTTSSLLRLAGVTRRYGVHQALSDIDLTIHRGEVVGLVGPSGSGKTTLLSIAAGWDQPGDGTITRAAELEADWRGIAVIPQGLGLMAELTALENVELAGGPTPGSGREALRSLGMDPDTLGARRPAQLSLGQQQRVAVARALVAEPRFVVADEPTAHQDEDHADMVMANLRRHARGDGGVLISTHDRRLLDHVDRVVELVDGRIVAAEAPAPDGRRHPDGA